MSGYNKIVPQKNDSLYTYSHSKNYKIKTKTKSESANLKAYSAINKKIKGKKYKHLKITHFSKEMHMQLKDILYIWLENNRLAIKEQTYAKYKRLSETHIIPCIGEINVRHITAVTVNKFLYDKAENGRLDGSGGLSPSYVKTLSFILVSALNFAAREGRCNFITGNIVTPIKRPADLQILTANEQNKLTQFIRENSSNKNTGILLSLYTGLRIGEVCGLRWSDINFDEGLIHIQNTISRITVYENDSRQPKTKLQLCAVKTFTSNRIIPIPEILYDILLNIKNDTDEFVLKGTAHPYTDPRTLQYAFHKTLKACNLRDTNFHALRHTFATRCIESGMDVKSLSEILGHSSVNITLNTYVHSSIGMKRDQLEAMVSFCNQKKDNVSL